MKSLRLWIDREGDPLYIEVLEGQDFTVEQLTQMRDKLETMRSDKATVILSSDWEVRVVA